MSEISRRKVLGATAGAAAATLLTTTGTAQAAESADAAHRTAPPATTKEADSVMAGTTTTLKYEAYLQSDEGDYVTDATFDAQANPADIWAYLDAVKVRYQQKYPTLTFTGHVQRYDQVVTEIAHP